MREIIQTPSDLFLFPVSNATKRPMCKGWPWVAKQLPDDFKRWASDAKRVTAWGALCGVRGGIFVVDVDCRDGKRGMINMAALFERHGYFPDTLTTMTPSGGRHYYFQWEDGVTNRQGIPADGIDVRGQNGYVVGPGSVMADGGVYKIIDDSPIASAPAWLIELIRAPSCEYNPSPRRGSRPMVRNSITIGHGGVASIQTIEAR